MRETWGLQTILDRDLNSSLWKKKPKTKNKKPKCLRKGVGLLKILNTEERIKEVFLPCLSGYLTVAITLAKVSSFGDYTQENAYKELRFTLCSDSSKSPSPETRSKEGSKMLVTGEFS